MSYPYRWGIVLVSLAMVRVAGYRLMGGKLTKGRDPASDVSPLHVRET